MKEVLGIHVEITYITCPYCNAESAGWFGDPRGEQVECEECNKTFLISALANIIIE